MWQSESAAKPDIESSRPISRGVTRKLRNLRPFLIGANVCVLLAASVGLSFAESATLVPKHLLGQAASSASSSAASSAIGPFTAKGNGTIDLTNTHSGPCAGIACTASASHCECDILNAKVTGTGIGNSSLVLNVTTDDDEGTLDGNGSCFPGTAYGTLCNASGACLGVQSAGTLCTSVIINPAVSVELTYNLNHVYYFQPEKGTGKFAGSSGGGNLAIALDLRLVGSTIAKNTGYTFIAGTFQKKP